MPKLYLKNYFPKNIQSKFMDLDKYYVSRKTRDMLSTSEGIILLRDNKMIRCIPNDVPPEDKGDYILDNSYYTEEEVYSQIPYEHIYCEVTELHFCVGKQSNVHFVIEGTYNFDNPSTSLVNNVFTNNKIRDIYSNFIPHNFYFSTSENINNELLLKEVNMILSII